MRRKASREKVRAHHGENEVPAESHRCLSEKRLGEVKRRHHVDLACCGDEPLEGRHRAGNRALAQESHQADHREAAIVDLGLQLLSLPLVTLVLVEVEGVVQVQRNRMRQKRATLGVPEHSCYRALECRELTRLAAAHVVSAFAWAEAHRSLGIELEDANVQDDLQLRFVGKVLPELWRADTGRAELVTGNLPRKVDAIRVHAVTDEPSHRYPAVLDLSVAKEANGRFVGLLPELTLTEVERIKESDRRVQPFRQSLQVGLGLR